MTLSRFRLAAIVLVAAMAGWFLNDALSGSPKRRPLLEIISRLWWVPLVLDEPQACHTHGHQEADHATLGEDGYPLVDHRRAL